MNFDRIKTTTTSTGQGNIATSSSALARCRPLSDIPVNTANVPLLIEDEAGSDWELSYCTILTATSFSRDTLIKGSNGASKVNFGAGTKAVSMVVPAAAIDKFAGAGNVVVTAIADPSAATIPIYIGGVPKQISVPDFLAAYGQATGQLPAATAMKGANLLAITQDDGAEHQVTLANLAAKIAELNGAGTPAADTTAPTFVSAQVANTAPGNIVITMSEALAAFTPATTAFTASGGRTVNTITVNGATVTAAVTPVYTSGDSITIQYTKPGANALQDGSNNQAASFGPSAVTNNIAAASATVPGAPTIGTAVAGNGYIDVAFTAPASDGGSAILDYTATLSTGQTATGTTSPIRVTAPNGTAATATVKARNGVGSSAASAASNSVTPAAPASTVTGVTVSPATVTLAGAGTQTFTATVAGSNSPSQAVTWTTTAGSITSGGVFTAPAATGSAQTVTITATSTQDGTKSGTATVTVPVAGATAYTITPYTAGNVPKTTLSLATRADVWGTGAGQLARFVAGAEHTGGGTYFNFAPYPASARCGWSPLGTTPTSSDFVTVAQNSAGDVSLNGLVPMATAASPSWINQANLWVNVNTGIGTKWCFWIMGVNGDPQNTNPAGMEIVA